jgi:putative FmdB family regulatory protein
MPSYQYECKNCSKQWTEYHGYDESPTVCPFCEQNDFKKIYNYTTTINKLTEVVEYKNNNKTGQKTRQFIEESRKELQEQKENMRGK